MNYESVISNSIGGVYVLGGRILSIFRNCSIIFIFEVFFFFFSLSLSLQQFFFCLVVCCLFVWGFSFNFGFSMCLCNRLPHHQLSCINTKNPPWKKKKNFSLFIFHFFFFFIQTTTNKLTNKYVNQRLFIWFFWIYLFLWWITR